MRPLPVFSAAVTAALTSMVLSATPAAGQDALTPAQEQAVRDLIRSHLLENPEIIEEAIVELQLRRQEEERQAAQEQIAALTTELYEDPRDFSIGPADAPVQVVEFFDYNCGFCRRSTSFMRNLIDNYDGQVRVIFKEAPVLGEGSLDAARWAIAAHADDQYLNAHFALMDSGERLDAQSAEVVLRTHGLNIKAIKDRRDADETSEQLTDTVALLQAVSGGRAATPAFIVNDQLIMGADLEGVQALIDGALGVAQDER